MHLEAALKAFVNALHTQDKSKVLMIINDQEWRQELAQPNYKTNHPVLDKCKKDAQLSYEFLILLRLLEDVSVTVEQKEKEHINRFKEVLHKIVDDSNVDIDIYNLNFLANSEKNKIKQSVLGKAKKEGKSYPNIPTSALITMNPEFWNLDAKVPYLDSAKGEKKGLKIHLENGKITRGQQHEALEGEFLYVLSPKGGLYAIKEKGTKKKHSSFRAGQPVISAGHMHVKDGKITKIDSISGHYTPPPKQTLLACLILKEQNMIDDNCIVHLYGYDPQPLGAILQEHRYAALVEECHKTLDPNREPDQKVISKLVKQHEAKQRISPHIYEEVKKAEKIYGIRAGYKSALDVLDHFENSAVFESVAGKGAEIVNFEIIRVTAGGTQSQGYRCTLNDGRTFFIKQTDKQEHVTKQRAADQRIRKALGAYADEAPIPFMLRGDNFGENKGIAIFPNVDGYMLLDSYRKQKKLNDRNPESYKRLSAALSKLHISGMLNEGQLEDFYATGCDLTGKNILYHDDFQPSNMMLTNRGDVYFVDTDAVDVINGKEYKNLLDLLELKLNTPGFAKAILEGYLSNFEIDKQALVLSSIQKNLKTKHKFEISPAELPILPVDKLAPIVEEVVKDEPALVTKSTNKSQTLKKPGKIEIKGDFEAIQNVNAQKIKEAARKRVAEEALPALQQDEALSSDDQQLLKKVAELIRAKAIELPSHITPVILINYLKGEVQLEELLQNKPQKRTQQREAVGKAGGKGHSDLMAELNQRFNKSGKSSAKEISEQENEPEPVVEQQIQGKDKVKKEHRTVKHKVKEVLSAQLLNKKLSAAAEEGVIAVNRPLEGENGIVNYLFGKATLIEERKVDDTFKQKVEADRQAGRAVQDKEAFLQHVQNFESVRKILSTQEEPPKQENQQQVKSNDKPIIVEIIEEEITLSMPVRTTNKPASNSNLEQNEKGKTPENVHVKGKTTSSVVQEIIEEEITLPMPKRMLKGPQHSHARKKPVTASFSEQKMTDKDAENISPNAPKVKSVYDLTWDDFYHRIKEIDISKSQSTITKNAHSSIVTFMKKHKQHHSRAQQEKRIDELRDLLNGIHINNIKNPALKQFIKDFQQTYKTIQASTKLKRN